MQKLSVTVFRAHGLQDLKNFTGEALRCQCELHGDHSSKGAKFKTQVASGSLDPVWEETHELDPYLPGNALDIAISDKSSKTSGKYKATVSVPGDFFHPYGFEGILPLCQGGRETEATVHIEIKVLDAEARHEEDHSPGYELHHAMPATPPGDDHLRPFEDSQTPPPGRGAALRPHGGHDEVESLASQPTPPSRRGVRAPQGRSPGSYSLQDLQEQEPAAEHTEDARRRGGREPHERSPGSYSLQDLRQEQEHAAEHAEGAQRSARPPYLDSGFLESEQGEPAGASAFGHRHESCTPPACGSAASVPAAQPGQGPSAQGAAAAQVVEQSRIVRDILAKGRVIGERYVHRDELSMLGNLVQGEPLPAIREPYRPLPLPPSRGWPGSSTGELAGYAGSRTRLAAAPSMPARHVVASAAPVHSAVRGGALVASAAPAPSAVPSSARIYYR